MGCHPKPSDELHHFSRWLKRTTNQPLDGSFLKWGAPPDLVLTQACWPGHPPWRRWASFVGFSHHRPWRRDRGKNSWENVPQKGSKAMSQAFVAWLVGRMSIPKFLTALVQYWINFVGFATKKIPKLIIFMGLKPSPVMGVVGWHWVHSHIIHFFGAHGGKGFW